MPSGEVKLTRLQLQDIAFLVSLLDDNDKRELLLTYQDAFRRLTRLRIISRSWFYRMVKDGYVPSGKAVIVAYLFDDRVAEWVNRRVAEKIERAKVILDNLSRAGVTGAGAEGQRPAGGGKDGQVSQQSRI